MFLQKKQVSNVCKQHEYLNFGSLFFYCDNIILLFFPPFFLLILSKAQTFIYVYDRLFSSFLLTLLFFNLHYDRCCRHSDGTSFLHMKKMHLSNKRTTKWLNISNFSANYFCFPLISKWIASVIRALFEHCTSWKEVYYTWGHALYRPW